ncbi:MAG: flagellar hook-basal body complex protein [Planctomycetota bacterium]
MNYGLYLSASGVLTNSYRQDVFANNLANVNTVGFKPDLPTLSPRPAEADEDPTPLGTANALLDRLGGGVLAGPQRTSFAAGPVEQTGRALDFAFTDSTSFLSVEHTDPATGRADVRLTRDGRLALDGTGYLVTAAGHRVLGGNDQPIQLAPGVPVMLTPDGRLQQNGNDAATLAVATVNDTTQLKKTGANLFAFAGDDPRTKTSIPDLRVGALESSATNPISTMMAVMASGKAAQSNGRMIQYHDQLMDRAVNTLGRVA